jgi:hypothetical protein
VSHSGEGFHTDRQRRWWFATHGDTVSVRAFHGSNTAFVSFDVGRAGSATDEGFLGTGLYFSTDVNIARPHSNLYETTVQFKRPLVLEVKTWEANKKQLIRDALGLPMSATADQVTAKAKSMGFDAVIADYSPIGYGHQEIVVFDNNQVARPKRTQKFQGF